MSQQSTRRFQRDEFDEVAQGDGRRGAHRARSSPALAVVPVLLVVVAVVAVVVGTLTVLGDGESTQAAPGDGGQPAATEPAPTSEAPPPPPPAADRALPVTVLNGTDRSGLAGTAAELLTGLGWTAITTGNVEGEDQPPTTVFFAAEEQRVTAEALGADLFGAPVAQSDAYQGLTVVLGDDYQP